MMRQTGAILLDAYRELNARKLFWFVLGITALAVVVFALLGINEKGVSFAVWTIEIPGVNTSTMSKEFFYKSYFVYLGIGIWLTWIATVLALVSTAPIIPDFVSSGSIELSLSKPIGRLRLFLTKYLAALLFVVLQVAVFALGGFLVLGIRGGVWMPTVFLAVPLVTIFFSYLYCVCALLGLITRSSVASLLITILVWFVMFMLQQAETGLLTFKTMQDVRIRMSTEQLAPLEADIERIEAQLADARAAQEADPTDDNEFEVSRFESRLDGRTDRRDDLLQEIESAEESRESLERWQGRAYAVKTVLPKTAETIALLERWMIPLDEVPRGDGFESEATVDEDGEPIPEETLQRRRDFEQDMRIQEAASLEAAEVLRERPLWWVLGTSLGFEFVILGLASWIFVRRDF